MSVENFINELQERNLLSDRLVEKLREAAADSNKTLSARTLADFLVRKNHLSSEQATEVIACLESAGVNVDKVGPPSTIISSLPMPQRSIDDDKFDPDDDPDSSSIFAPYMTGAGKKKASASPTPPDDDDELTLVAIDEEEGTTSADGADKVAVDGATARDTFLSNDEEITLLPPEPTRPTSTPARPERHLVAPTVTETGELADASPNVVVAPAGKAGKKPRRSRDGRDARKTHLRKKQWDSPLMLYGGGGLLLLLIIGGGAWWLLLKEKGDQELTQAKASLDGGDFAGAIEHYQQFLEGSPNHPEHGKARVQLALARIRQATEANNFSGALELAPKELEAVEDEEKFNEVHGDLSSLLPQIALGLAQQAEHEGAGAEDVEKLVSESKTALELCNNVTYIPKTLRDEGQLNVVRETLQRVKYREQSHKALQDTLSAMEKAVAAGDPTAAYSAHKRLIKERPEQAGDAKLADMVKQTMASDQAAVKFVRDEKAAEAGDRPNPWVASLAVAQRRGNTAATAGPGGAVACVRVEGAVYGLDVATGKLLWRRYVGFSTAAWPTIVGSDVLVTDVRHNEVVRLNAATGKLVWRQIIGEAFSEPLVVGPRAFLAAKSGKLYVIDLASGARAGYLQFPQPLGPPPTTDRRQQRLYLTGNQFSLYSISLADLTCIGSYYLGHEATSVQVAPAQILNKLAVLKNDGVETSRLHVLALDDRGAVAGQETEKRLAGLTASPLLIEGRRLIVITDRGRFDVYEVGSGKGDEALAPVAKRDATDRRPVVRYVAVADGKLWVGDSQLTKFAILPTGDTLPVESIQNNFAGDAFDHPLELFGDTLISVRRPKHRAGAVVAATNTKQGGLLWETDLAVPPAGAPVVDPSGRAIAVANANGYVFRFDEAAIRSRVQDEPLTARSTPVSVKPLSGSVDLGGGRAAFYAAGSEQVLLYDPASGTSAAQWIELPSPLVCPATAFNNGFLAPLKIGQVFYLNPADGQPLAAPFQPKLAVRSVVEYRPAGVGAPTDRRFVITDGQERIYVVNLIDQPQSRLEAAADGKVSPLRITSPVALLGDLAIAAADGGHLVRYKLPSLESAGEAQLPGDAVWGPYRVGEQAILATADEQLVAISPKGDIAWKEPLAHGELAGAPLVVNGNLLLAYRKGIIERRGMADGKPDAQRDLEHPLAAGPVGFMKRLVLTADDGTLLVVDQP